MNRWPVIAVTCVLALAAGYVGLSLRGGPTDTDLINHYAARYVTEAPAGAAMTDCTGRPGQTARVRLVIDCRHPDGTDVQYLVGQSGQFVPHYRMEG